MKFNKLTELDLAGKRVLIRADMNVPVKNGVIGDDTRIRASLPSIEHSLQAGAGVILMTHLGRPTEGEPKPEDSLAPVVGAPVRPAGQTGTSGRRLASRPGRGCR
jgi:phosphoglycerate kinase